MSSRRKGSNESKDMWLKVNQKSLMKFEGVFRVTSKTLC